MEFITKPNGILDIDEGIICQQVNCCDAIGAGISGDIIDKYPIVKHQYHKFCGINSKHELFGRMQVVQVSDKLFVANIFSQLDFGDSMVTGAVYTNMETLTTILKRMDEVSDKPLYVPDHIGCGLAGGDWDEFLNIMKDTAICVVSMPG